MANYVISENTQQKLQALINERPAGTVGHVHGTGVRQVIHVKVIGEPDDDRKYECKPVAYKPDLQTWEEYGENVTCYVLEANEQDLRVDDRYVAIRYGITEAGDWIFVADNQYPLLKCHLEWRQDPDDYDKWKLYVTPDTLAGCGLKVEECSSDSGSSSGECCDKLAVDVEALAGDGLEVDDDSDSGTCDPLKVKEGCGITVDSDGVHVDVEALAGDGMTTQAGDFANDYCDKLAVDPGCGLRIADDGKLALDLEAIAFTDGLYGDNDICVIGVNAGCGITYRAENGEEQLIVDIDSLAGKGLQVTQDSSSCGQSTSDSSAEPEDCCPQLEVKPGECIKVDDDGVAVDTEPTSGMDITIKEFVGINPAGCGITYTTRTITFKRTPCGLFVDLEQGAEETYAIDIGAACCDCSSDSDSSSSSSSCGGAYWCLDGVCTWVEDCGSTDLSTDPCDEGCGQQGWNMTPEGTWVPDGEIFCDCGEPVYPPFDSPYPTHTTYCCTTQGTALRAQATAFPTYTTISGPYATPEECAAACDPTTYWCIESYVPYCFQGTEAEAAAEAGAQSATYTGPYATQAACETACGGTSSDSDSDSDSGCGSLPAPLYLTMSGPDCGRCGNISFPVEMTAVNPSNSCYREFSAGPGGAEMCPERGFGVGLTLNLNGTVTIGSLPPAYCGPPTTTVTPASMNPFYVQITYDVNDGLNCCTGEGGTVTLTITE